MYSKLQLTKKYLSYFYHASNGHGHGIHSPFVYDFVRKILLDKSSYEKYTAIETLRTELKTDSRMLTIQDFGAGSRINSHKQRSVQSIAKSALKPKKYAQLIHKIVHHFQPNTLVELGTSLGITSSYLASANPQATLYTFEGADEVAKVAKENFAKLNISNIQLTLGNFDETFPRFLAETFGDGQKVDFAFLDGNHREEPTIEYFKNLLPYIHENTILIFDDIHWSQEMENAWEYIKNDANVTLTIDLFFIGLVFFRKEQKQKEHFAIRF